MSLIVKVGKAGKRFLKAHVLPPAVHHLSYTRRIERIQTGRRICAMTFDDGPMDLPAAPDKFEGRCLTDLLLDTLGEFGARGTFDVVGDTSENYPDEAGKLGSPAWGGVKFDHYPDLSQDAKGGAEHNDRLIRRMLAGGHQITNHGYRHIIFGKKSVVYGKREFLGSVDSAVEDLRRLDTLMRQRYDYQITMGRPPHYVDVIGDGFTSYDVYDALGYQYMAASFDGAGWLPCGGATAAASLEAEVNAMAEPVRKALAEDPDFFCGQIIFQKDGYNMAKRTPVAWGLRLQLETLREYGYEVVTVGELMRESPFADLGREDPLWETLSALAKDRAVAYSDNTVRLDQGMTVGELAMLLAPKKEAMDRRWAMVREGQKPHAYAGALAWCEEKGILPPGSAPDAGVTALPGEFFAPVTEFTRRAVYGAWKNI